MKNKKFYREYTTIAFVLTLLVLAIYSYSQIDLNLTLSGIKVYQALQQNLITLGYFKRPISTAIFLTILAALFWLYVKILTEVRKEKIGTATLWKFSLIAVVILAFSYPAFSHDIFNYIFDTRLVVTHHVNPWEHTALDFPLDQWTRFMRWTHRTYPYGPLWLVLTIPFYLLGMGKFTLTLFWFKVLGAISYLVSTWSIAAIAQKLKPKSAAFAMALFALNPLILIEALVNAHIDITMTALLLIAIYFLVVRRREGLSLGFLFLSAATKFVTAAAIPVLIWWKGKEDRNNTALLGIFLALLVATAVVIAERELLPWYAVSPLSLVALLPHKKWIANLTLAVCLGLLLRYAPFLLRGDYSEWVRKTRDILTLIPLLLFLVWLIWQKGKRFLSVSS